MLDVILLASGDQMLEGIFISDLVGNYVPYSPKNVWYRAKVACPRPGVTHPMEWTSEIVPEHNGPVIVPLSSDGDGGLRRSLRGAYRSTTKSYIKLIQGLFEYA